MSSSGVGPADYARACVHAHVRGTELPPSPDDAFYSRAAACFVTLKKRGQLRGCIGTLEPAEPTLAAEIAHNARSSALHDPRFPPVREDELGDVTCSVDVLSPSEECSLADLDPARYGVIVSSGYRRGVLLPALEGVDTVAQQVGIALQKAGLPPDRPFVVHRFTVARYREGDPPAAASPAGAGPDD